MKIDVTGRQMDVTPALRQFAEEKLGKLDKVLDGPVEAHLVLAINKHRHSAEVKLVSRNVVLSCAAETGDLYASIGEAVDKLERQALKHKERIHDHKQRRAAREAGAGSASPAAASDAAEPASATARPRIVRSQRYRIKPMSAEDAVLELEATAEDLIVFREAETSRINVVYRLDDGSFALIDPEF